MSPPTPIPPCPYPLYWDCCGLLFSPVEFGLPEGLEGFAPSLPPLAEQWLPKEDAEPLLLLVPAPGIPTVIVSVDPTEATAISL
jgi:hypothetical protein